MDRVSRIEEILKRTFQPEHLEVIDESHLHAGHPGAATGMGHFRINLVSSRFAGLRTIQRHRLIYEALDEMLKTDIHALAINARSTDPGRQTEAT